MNEGVPFNKIMLKYDRVDENNTTTQKYIKKRENLISAFFTGVKMSISLTRYLHYSLRIYT